MGEDCLGMFNEILDRIEQDRSKVVIDGPGTLSEIMQTAYNYFISPRDKNCLTGEEFKAIVSRASRLCEVAKMPVIRGNFIDMVDKYDLAGQLKKTVKLK